MSNNFSSENLVDCDIMCEKYGTARQTTGDYVMRSRKDSIACRISKVRKHTLS